jgi:hypothetical protein
MISDSAILPLIPLNNRHSKRMFERDAIRVILPLEEVNTEFIFQLFNDECKATYNGLYNHYLELWLQTIEELIKTRKFPSVGIDKLWFERQYSPYGNA